MRKRRWTDRLVVAALIVLAVAIGADALRGRHAGDSKALQAPALAAPVPDSVRLVPSSTAFLQHCAAAKTSLVLAAGPRLVLRYDGPPCHLAPLRLHAVVHAPNGDVAYRGPATAADALAGNYARDSRAEARLLGAAVTCGGRLAVSGGGLAVRGPIRCR